MKQTQNKEKMVTITEYEYNDLQSNIFAIDNLERKIDQLEDFCNDMEMARNDYKIKYENSLEIIRDLLNKVEIDTLNIKKSIDLRQ